MIQQPSLAKSLSRSSSPVFGEIALGLGLDPLSRSRISPSKIGEFLARQLAQGSSDSALLVTRAGGLSLSMNPDGRLELGSRHALVIGIQDRELQISCFDEQGARVEAFAHSVAGLPQLESTFSRSGCAFFVDRVAPAVFQLGVRPNAGGASYWELKRIRNESEELRLVLAMAMWRLRLHELSALQPFPAAGVSIDNFWYQVKLGDFQVAMGFSHTDAVRSNTPYPPAGHYLCLEIVSRHAEPALRVAKSAATSRPIRDAVASIKQLQLPFPRLCLQVRLSEMPRLYSFLGELRKAS